MRIFKKLICVFLSVVLAAGTIVFNVQDVNAVATHNGLKYKVNLYIEEGAWLYTSGSEIEFWFMPKKWYDFHETEHRFIKMNLPERSQSNNITLTYVSDAILLSSGDNFAGFIPNVSNELALGAVRAYVDFERRPSSWGDGLSGNPTRMLMNLEIYDKNNNFICYKDYGEIVEISPDAQNVNDIYVRASLSVYTLEDLFEYNSTIIPAGYNFETDRYYFSNIYKRIDKEYYVSMFGGQKGTELYIFDQLKNNTTGHCYGIATTTAAILDGYPEVFDFNSWFGLPYSNLVDVKKGSINEGMGITVLDYIKYAQLYQASSAISAMFKDDNHNGFDNTYNAVKNAALNNSYSTGIIIVVRSNGDSNTNAFAHAVYAVGVDGNDILVNDSEIPGEIQRIRKIGNEWELVTPRYSVYSKNGTIQYVDDYLTPYETLLRGTTVESVEIDYSEEKELLGAYQLYLEITDVLDIDKAIVYSENDGFYFSSSHKMFEISSVNGTDNAEDESRLYWLSESDTVEAQNTGEDSAVLKLVGNELKISASVPAETGVKITVNENGENKINFDTDEGEFINFTFTTLDENNEFIDTVISGTAHGCDVTAEATEAGGIKVNGLDNIHISYETSDLVVDTEVNVDDGSSVNISVNENEIITDWKCSHSTDENADNICDNCGEVIDSVPDKECTHMCHSSNSFLQFIWKIVNFFSKLFNMNPVCSCGDKHY